LPFGLLLVGQQHARRGKTRIGDHRRFERFARRSGLAPLGAAFEADECQCRFPIHRRRNRGEPPLAELRRQFHRKVEARIDVLRGARTHSETGTQRIANHHGLPTQVRHRGVIRLREVATGHVRRKQDLRPDCGVEEWLVNVSRNAGHAIANQVADQ
jgi:hypothetical protein